MQRAEQVAKFEGILRAHGITDPVAEVLVKDPGLQGEGFASQAQYITIKFKNEDVAPLNLFAKVVSQSESHTKMLDEVKSFEKEATFLTKYVPAAQEMWRAKGCEGPLDLFPKCYYGDSRMTLMENLVLDKGYCLLDKVTRQNFETAKFSLRTLATHHAVSYALIQEEGGPEKFFQRFPYLDLDCFSHPEIPTMMGHMFSHSLNANIGILENNLVEGREEALAFLQKFQNTAIFEIVLSHLQTDANDIRVLNHGDYWNNNMMFLKDKDTGKIVAHKAIDLQTSRYNTPVLDLIYYLYTSVQPDVRIGRLKELLQFYLGILIKVSTDMGYPINLTYEQLLLQYRKRLSFGFWWSFFLVVGPGVQAMKGLDINTVDVHDWGKVFGDLMKKWIVANPEYALVIAEELVKLVGEYKKLSLESQ